MANAFIKVLIGIGILLLTLIIFFLVNNMMLSWN